MSPRRHTGMRFVVLALLIGACAGPSAGDPTEPSSVPTTTTTTSPVPTTTTPSTLPEEPPVTGETPASILDPILADAAERTGIPVDDLVVVRSEFVEWPDGSLGCPEDGMLYPQVITPGYWVQVDADGEVLDYRAGTTGFFRLCESPTKTPPLGSSPDA
jgi:hypothetical protein